MAILNPEQKDDPLAETIRVWEPIAGRKLSREDARQIRENLLGFFGLLIEWDAASTTKNAGPEAKGRLVNWN